MTDPRQLSFWSDEYQRALDEFGPLALRILFDGAQSGAALLPTAAELLIDWDTFNQSALDWLSRYGLHWIAGINDTTRKQTVRAIDLWVQSGEPLDNLIARLTPIYGARRAELIATTEVTRIYAEGNLQAWEASGVVGAKRWQTAVDERVCKICGPLQGKVVGLRDGWSADASGGIIAAPDGLLAPPAHQRCRCWLQPIVSDELFVEQLRKELANVPVN